MGPIADMSEMITKQHACPWGGGLRGMFVRDDKCLGTDCYSFDGLSPGLREWDGVAVSILLIMYSHLPWSSLRLPLGAAKV